MKIKHDFVTNSSSTSYIGWGIEVYKNDMRNNEVLLKKLFDNYKSSRYFKNITFEEFKNIGYSELMENFKSDIIEFSHTYDNDYFLAHPEKMKDDETLFEFKQKIISELKEYGIVVQTLTFIEEIVYDG